MLRVQKEILDEYGETGRAWIARVKSEVDLWSELPPNSRRAIPFPKGLMRIGNLRQKHEPNVMAEPDHNHPLEATIEINLNRLPQLFNSLDPAPFHERDLDQDAEEYIIGSAEEIPRKLPLVLVIHLPRDQMPETGTLDLDAAIHNYFAYRETSERRRLRLLFRDGRITLVIGLAFLFCCVLMRELAFSFGKDTPSDIFGEGMLIIGWVAMWRPLEIFLYEWVPIRRRCQILARLSKMPVLIRPK